MTERNSAHFYVALEKYIESKPDGHVSDLEFLQQYAFDEIEHLKNEFKSGDSVALMKAIYHCAAAKIPMPEWVSQTYIKAIADVLLFAKYKSWDSVFGSPYPKGKHLNAIKKELRLKAKVFAKVESRSQNGEPISDCLFELVGKELGLCKTLVSEYYYSEKRQIIEFHEILKNNGIT